MLRLGLAAFHLIALGLGLGAVVARGSALREPPTAASLARVFRWDTVWGITAVLFIVTGLWRLFGATEKATAYYLENHLFWAKMGFLALILMLEVWPMLTLIQWRRAVARGAPAEAVASASAGRRIAIVSHSEALIIVVMVFVAVALARGYGAG